MSTIDSSIDEWPSTDDDDEEFANDANEEGAKKKKKKKKKKVADGDAGTDDDGGVIDDGTIFRFDERDFRICASILRKLGMSSVRLMTNNPAKVDRLIGCGIDVVMRATRLSPV